MLAAASQAGSASAQGSSSGQAEVEAAGQQALPEAGAPSEPDLQYGWLVMHLGIRDFFIYTMLKEGAALLGEGGIRGAPPAQWSRDAQAFQRWAQVGRGRGGDAGRGGELGVLLYRTRACMWRCSCPCMPMGTQHRGCGVQRYECLQRACMCARMQGRTGFPFVDASMRELAVTGAVRTHPRSSIAYLRFHRLPACSLSHCGAAKGHVMKHAANPPCMHVA